MRLPRITIKVWLTFFKSVSQFDNVLIVSQMLIRNEKLSYIEKDFTAELLSVFPKLLRLLFCFQFRISVFPDSSFSIRSWKKRFFSRASSEFVPVVIGQSNCFGFSFSTVIYNYKPLPILTFPQLWPFRNSCFSLGFMQYCRQITLKWTGRSAVEWNIDNYDCLFTLSMSLKP